GSVLAAVTSSLALLIVARVLQAASFALYPICIAILREELAAEAQRAGQHRHCRDHAVGGGTGLVVVGLLMSGDAGYHRVFWLTTAFTVIVIIIVVTLVP
ncbi:MFS transporter, partial [Mycobacterium sp. ITM-2017-0098]